MKSSCVRMASLVFLGFTLSGCVTKYCLKEPLSFAPNPSKVAPINMRVTFPDGLSNRSFKKKAIELLVGQAIEDNIGAALQTVYQSVTVDTGPATNNVQFDRTAVVRFGPKTNYEVGLTIFQEISLRVDLDVEIRDTHNNTVLYKTSVTGKKSGHQPPNLGLLTLVAINSFYRNLIRDSVQMALDSLAKELLENQATINSGKRIQ